MGNSHSVPILLKISISGTKEIAGFVAPTADAKRRKYIKALTAVVAEFDWEAPQLTKRHW